MPAPTTSASTFMFFRSAGNRLIGALSIENGFVVIPDYFAPGNKFSRFEWQTLRCEVSRNDGPPPMGGNQFRLLLRIKVMPDSAEVISEKPKFAKSFSVPLAKNHAKRSKHAEEINSGLLFTRLFLPVVSSLFSARRKTDSAAATNS